MGSDTRGKEQMELGWSFPHAALVFDTKGSEYIVTNVGL